MEKVEYLDSLKGLCAFIVVFHHFGNIFFPTISTGNIDQQHHWLEPFIRSSPLSIIFNGNFAVSIFFIVGGFALSYKFFSKSKALNPAGAIVKRYLRLSIPIFAAVTIAYLFMQFKLFSQIQLPPFTKTYWMVSFWQFQPNFLELIKNSFWDTFFNGSNKYLIILWTMQFEFYSSILIYLSLPFVKKTILRIIIYPILLFFSLNTYFLPFLLGVMISDYYIARKNKILVKNNIIQKIFALASFFVGIYLVTPSVHTRTLISDEVLRNIISGFFIILAIIHSTNLKKILSIKPFQLLGKISFSIYLLHLIILCSFTSSVFLILIQHFNYVASALTSLLLSIPLIILSSYLFTTLIDTQVVKISNHLYSKLFIRSK